MNDIYHCINCNVSDCVFNERGCNCNLERISISKESGESHICRSYIPFEDKKEGTTILNNSPSSYEDYFNL